MRDLTSLLTTSTDHLPDVSTLLKLRPWNCASAPESLGIIGHFSGGTRLKTILLRQDSELGLSFPPKNLQLAIVASAARAAQVRQSW